MPAPLPPSWARSAYRHAVYCCWPNINNYVLVFSQKQFCFDDLTVFYFVHCFFLKEAFLSQSLPQILTISEFWETEGRIGDKTKLSSPFTMSIGKGPFTLEKQLPGKPAFWSHLPVIFMAMEKWLLVRIQPEALLRCSFSSRKTM